MIQNQTEIYVKDNSGILKGRCINAGKTHQSVGARVKVTVSKAKVASKQKSFKRTGLQDLLIIQTKKSIVRKDGSTLMFNGNKGVCVSLTSRTKLQLGFKRINTAVVFELKKSYSLKSGLSHNLMKLAKGLV